MASRFVTWNDKKWRASVEILSAKLKKSTADLLNQFALDVTARAFDSIPPKNPDPKRLEIKLFLTEPLATRVKLAKSGKRKGQYIRKGARNKQLQRVHLISQYWRAQQGKKGLYGKSMLRYAGTIKQRRQIGVGGVKSVFIPIIRTLNPVCQYKVPVSKTRKFARWPGSRGDGRAKWATPGWNPRAMFQIAYRARMSQEGKLQGIYDQAVNEAINWKKGKMIRQAERMLQPKVNEFNAAQKK